MHYRNLTKQFLDTVIDNANLRPLFVVLHSNILFYVKLFEAIILSICRIVWFIFKKWKFSFANFNREERWTKNLIVSLENEIHFFKVGKSSLFY